MKNRIAIFASGGGSNAESIIKYFQYHDDISVDIIISNKISAGVLEIAKSNNIRSRVLSKKDFYESDAVINELKSLNIDFVILAGFLWKIPSNLIASFPSKILNIHPSLLPKYGGEGMYGHFVHEAVQAAGDKFSGMTIHVVNEEYDKGKIIFQASTQIDQYDSPKDISLKVLALEHSHYPRIIEKYINSFPIS